MSSFEELNFQVFDFENKLANLIRFFYTQPEAERKKAFDYLFFNSREYELIEKNSIFQQISSVEELYSMVGLRCDVEIEKWRAFDQLPDDRPQIVV